jgi:hypothetical protein
VVTSLSSLPSSSASLALFLLGPAGLGPHGGDILDALPYALEAFACGLLPSRTSHAATILSSDNAEPELLPKCVH